MSMLESVQKEHGKCKIVSLSPDLLEEFKEVQSAWDNDPDSISSYKISNHLGKLGYSIHKGTIERHLARRCSCDN